MSDTQPSPSPMPFTHVELVDTLMKFGMPNLDAQICARELHSRTKATLEKPRTPGSDAVGDDMVRALNGLRKVVDDIKEGRILSRKSAHPPSAQAHLLFEYYEVSVPTVQELEKYMYRAERASLQPPTPEPVGQRKFNLGDRVEKIKGSAWHGVVVGFYSTELTPIGYAVESEREPGSVQIYPEAALSQTKKE